MNETLKDFVVGDSGRVLGFQAGGGAYRRKLLSMGLTPGVEIQVTRVAPLGDPVELRVRGTSLSLRRDEASVLEVERVG
ncbi:ferrous iron transport protein A [Thiocystis minor]|uniref:FeoA family protein n=1 Tax=Thiocystis minor TaxID=61597 RepID=UPI001911555F|nr:FeoA family protein [Thiocystis minor]MBK5967061.1 ferrous iron transport protein A [Thiocystis minor]